MKIKNDKSKTKNKSSKSVVLKCSLISIGIEFLILGIMTPFRIQKTEAENMQASNFNFSIISKKNDVSNSKYLNGYVIGFNVSLENKSSLNIKEFIGNMKINLESSNYEYSYNFTLYDKTNGIKENSTKRFLITIDESPTTKALALYNASISKLKIEFKINQINFSNNKTKSYAEEYKVIKPYGSYAEDTDSEKQDKLNKEKYDNAISLYNSGEYEKALKIFKEISSYEDSSTYIEKINKQKYENAISLYNSGNYEEALKIFQEIYSYSDSSKYAQNCINEIKEQKYQSALSLLESGEYDDAIKKFQDISSYKDSKTQIMECKYRKAIYLYESKNLLDSYKLFSSIKTYKESSTYMSNIENSVEYLALNGEYQKTIDLLKAFGKTESNSDLYAACNSAIQGNYVPFVALLNPTKVIVDSNLTCLQNSAFSNCENVTEIVLPDSLTEIGANAFYKCSSLTTINLPDSIKKIGRHAFYYCTSLRSFKVPSSLETLGEKILEECSSLEEISTKFTVKFPIYRFCTINGGSYWEDKWTSYPNLTKIIITEGNVIPAYFLASLPKTIKQIQFNEDIIEVKDYAFYDSKAEFILPSTVKKIGNYAYSYSKTPETITLHEGLEYIGEGAFSYSRFETINIPSTVTYIGDYVFDYYGGNSALEKINFNGTKEKWLSIVSSKWNYGMGYYYDVECIDAIYHYSIYSSSETGWKDK